MSDMSTHRTESDEGKNGIIMDIFGDEVYRDPSTGFPDKTETEGQDWPDTPPPYNYGQAGEVAELVTKCMEAAIKAAEDVAEAYERDFGLRDIRTAQGVGIVLAGMLHTFRTNSHAYSEPCDEGARQQAYYYLEDF